jgi:hypothetical protein
MLKISSLRVARQVLPLVVRRTQSTALKPLAEIPGPKTIPLLGNFLNFKAGELFEGYIFELYFCNIQIVQKMKLSIRKMKFEKQIVCDRSQTCNSTCKYHIVQ